MRTINELAREYLVEEGRNTLHKMQHIMQIGSRAMRELNIDVVAPPKRVFIKPNSYHAIDVPEDFYDWTLVGICLNGRIYQLSEDNGMCLPHMVNDCGELQPEISSTAGPSGNYAFIAGYGQWLYNWTAINEYGELNAKAFGVGGGQNFIGTFKYDEARRQIVVSPSVQSREIALEYISTGINQELILVPDDATECVVSFLKWKTAKSLAERREFKGEYYTNFSQLQQRNCDLTIQGVIAAARKGYYQAAKS